MQLHAPKSAYECRLCRLDFPRFGTAHYSEAAKLVPYWISIKNVLLKESSQGRHKCHAWRINYIARKTDVLIPVIPPSFN